MKRSKLRDAIVIALIAGVGGFSASALAQEATTNTGTEAKQEKKATDLDAIVVTGTRIQS